jgi:hypothetical protein
VFSIVRLLISNRRAARAAKTVAVGVSLRESYFRSKTPSAITVGAEVNFWNADGIGGDDVVQDSTPRDRRRRGWPADVR